MARITNPTIGAVSELEAASSLMRAGCLVFRALASDSPIDLISITPKGKVMRVSVKTAYLNRDGSVSFKKPRRRKTRTDIYALCLKQDSGNAVVYTRVQHPTKPVPLKEILA